MDFENVINNIFGGSEGIWDSIWKQAQKGGIEITKMMLELFYVMKSNTTNPIDKALIGAALAYQLLPEDALPRDRFKWLGFLDNGLTIAFAYNKVRNSITPQIENQVNATLSQWFGLDMGQLPSYQSDRPNGPVVAPMPAPNVYQPQNVEVSQPQNAKLKDEDVIID